MAKATNWLTIAALLLGLSQTQAENSNEVFGIWLTAAGDAKIRVTPCSSGLCGVIVWLKQPIDPATGKPQVDDKNADKMLAHRPIIGLNIFSAMHPSGGRRWAGKIYNADNGKTYSSELRPAGTKKLEVHGCVLSFLCGGETWTSFRRPAAGEPAGPLGRVPHRMPVVSLRSDNDCLCADAPNDAKGQARPLTI